MSAPTRTDAQQRADEIRVFQRELARLEQERVLALSPPERTALQQHHERLLAAYTSTYDIDADTRSKQLSLGMRIASFLGALALAASVFFLFYQFWGLLPTAAQVGILLCAPLGCFAATAWMQRRDGTGYFTKLVAMVTFACFVLDIVMLGQIFNITPSDRVFLAWAALALLLAYLCDLRLLLAFGILCIVAFIAARMGNWGGLYWLHFGQRPENFFPAALLLFLIPSIVAHERFAGFAGIYRVFGLLSFFLPVLVLSNWGAGSYLSAEPRLVAGWYEVLGFVASGLAIWLGARRQWPEVVNTGVTFFVIFLYTKYYDWWWAIMPKYLFFFVLGLTAVLCLLVLKRLRAGGYRIFRSAP